MLVSKFICVPMIIAVPALILIIESKDSNFSKVPSDAELRMELHQWKANKPTLRNKPLIQEPIYLANSKEVTKFPLKNPSITKPEQNPLSPIQPESDFDFKKIDLSISSSLNYFQELSVTQLKDIINHLNPEEHPELVYLANERIIDSAPQSTLYDIHQAATYISKNERPLWNPEAELRNPLKLEIKVSSFHKKQVLAMATRIESALFYGSGGTVEPTVIISETEATNQKQPQTITLSGTTHSVSFNFISIPDSEKMINDAIAQLVTKAIKSHNIPIKHTDQVIYSHYTRLTWELLSISL